MHWQEVAKPALATADKYLVTIYRVTKMGMLKSKKVIIRNMLWKEKL